MGSPGGELGLSLTERHAEESVGHAALLQPQRSNSRCFPK